MVQLQRELTVGDRAYRLELSTHDDERATVSLVSRGADGETLSELTGVFALDDLTMIGRVLTPELDSLAAWFGRPQRVPADPRTRHPNHGTAWSPDEEQRLSELFSAGLAVREIAKALQRSVGGIRSRLQRLGLDPATR